MTFEKQMAALRRDVIPGRYDVDVSSDWNCPIVPQGGLMAAVAAKAMTLELTGGEGTRRNLCRKGRIPAFSAQISGLPTWATSACAP